MFSGERQMLVRALEHMFVLESFFVARIGGRVVGIAACTSGDAKAVKSERRELVRHMGWLRGTIASIVFKRYFEKPPESAGENVATVGFVATAADARGRGVAYALLEHIHAHEPYDAFVLEAANTNTNALKLYEKLGHREFRRDRQRFPRLSGFDFLVHMVYRKPSP